MLDKAETVTARKTAVVTGMIATYPVGGVVWDYGQYALGLERLGFDVYYLEDTALDAYDPNLRRYVGEPDFGVAYLSSSLRFLSESLGSRWHLRAANGQTYGLDASALSDVLKRADLFLNVSGSAVLREQYMVCPIKAFIDTDPGWNHFRNYPRLDASPGWDGACSYRAHDYFFTYAERMGAHDCVLPSLGIEWRPTRPPVVMDQWRSEPPGEKWTTVLTWKNHHDVIEYKGVCYGGKEVEFERIEHIPRQLSCPLEIAAGGTDRPEDPEHAKSWYPTRPRWEALGWSVVDSHAVSATPASYRHYVQGSRGELSVAKNAYVATRSGWFSCRSSCYLAAGRPVVVQDTGFSEIIPCWEGLLAFSCAEEAVESVREVESDYARHASAAHRIAHDYFSSEVVLGDLLRRVGL